MDGLCLHFQKYLSSSILLADSYHQKRINIFEILLFVNKKSANHFYSIISILPEDNQNTYLWLKRFPQLFYVYL